LSLSDLRKISATGPCRSHPIGDASSYQQEQFMKRLPLLTYAKAVPRNQTGPPEHLGALYSLRIAAIDRKAPSE
jgi:hypothetical protein